ncbi:MAG: hypothetical protein GY805_25600 [Chloroflexi bacterium]|nr:hypothetical protein [Chloroflexota bacterium]
MKRIFIAGLFTSLIVLIGVGSAFAAPPAYIDPNTGGMLAQALIVVLGMATGAWFFFANHIKVWFNRMKRSFLEKKNGTAPQEVVSSESPQKNNVQ